MSNVGTDRVYRFQESRNILCTEDALDGDKPYRAAAGACDDYESGAWSMTEICHRLGVSRRIAYLNHFEVRRVNAAGTFRLKAKQPFLTNALGDEQSGLEEVRGGTWNIVYRCTLLGRIDARSGRITGA